MPKGPTRLALDAIREGNASEGQVLVGGNALWERPRTGTIGAALEPLREEGAPLQLRLALRSADEALPWEALVDDRRRRLAAAHDYVTEVPPGHPYEDGMVDPLLLQIVCSEVYRHAEQRNPEEPSLTLADYLEAGGPSGVFRRYLDALFERVHAEDHLLLALVLQEMTTAHATKRPATVSRLSQSDILPDRFARDQQFLRIRFMREVVRQLSKGFSGGVVEATLLSGDQLADLVTRLDARSRSRTSLLRRRAPWLEYSYRRSSVPPRGGTARSRRTSKLRRPSSPSDRPPVRDSELC